MEYNLRNDKLKSRAIVIRCSDATYRELLDYIRTSPDCFLIFSKTSNLKLYIREEGW